MICVEHQLSPISLSLQLAPIFILLLTFPMSAASVTDEAMVGELMELSGLTQQIPRLPHEYTTLVDQVLMGLERQRYPVSNSLRRQIRQSFVDALTPERLEPEIRSRLVHELSSDTTLATVNWLRSDLGKKVTAVELDASSAEKSIQFATFLLQLQLERPDPERLQLVRRVEEVIKGSELATEAWEAVVAGVARALEAEYQTKDLQTKDNLEAYLASVRGSMKGMFQQGRVFQGLFTYRTLTDQELKQYVEFLEAPVGRDVTHVMNAAVQGAAIDAIQHIQPSRPKTLPSKGMRA
jgi:hypothetical protein